MSNWEINRELKEAEKERFLYAKDLENKRQHMANMLLNEMGNDMQNVLNGHVKIKLTFWERIKYSFKYYMNKIFNTI